MPHLVIDYSGNLEDAVDIARFCAAMHGAMVETGLFEQGGIRVRALRVDHYVVADADPRNGYIHMALRVGSGRSLEERKRAGETIFAAACDFLATRFDSPHFALSFAMDELDPDLNWKKNSMHARLRGK